MSATNPGPGTFTVCAWCRADNQLTDSSAPIHCWSCGHRADRPRRAIKGTSIEGCDCAQCQGTPGDQLDMFQGLGVHIQGREH
jgi:hypothetical protein